LLLPRSSDERGRISRRSEQRLGSAVAVVPCGQQRRRRLDVVGGERPYLEH
jgi:hypothetical protein